MDQTSMGQQQQQPGDPIIQSHHAYDLARADDLRFLQAVERGVFPLVSAAVRIRQIRRALAVRTLAGSGLHRLSCSEALLVDAAE